MRVKTKKLNDKLTQIEACVTASEVSTAITEVRELLAKQLRLRADGLHTFAELAKSQAGVEDFEDIVAAQTIESFIPMAIGQAKLTPAFVPRAQQSKPLREGASFTFTLDIMQKPEYELTSYEPVEVELAAPAVSELQVEAQIKEMTKGYMDFVEDDPHPLKEGDSCLIAFTAYQDGKEIEALTTGDEGRVYTLNENLMPPSFDEQLIGMAPGDTKDFDFTAPDLDDEGNIVDVTVSCSVRMLENRKQINPEISDEWLEKYMPLYHSVDEMRRSIKAQLMQGAEQDYHRQLLSLVASKLSERFEGAIDDAIYEATQQNLIEAMRMEMAQQGIDFDEYAKEQGNNFNIQLMLQTRENLVQGFTLDAVFKHEKLTLDDDDITAWCRMVNPNQSPVQTRKDMERSGRGFAMREGASRLKANEWAAAQAKVSVPKN